MNDNNNLYNFNAITSMDVQQPSLLVISQIIFNNIKQRETRKFFLAYVIEVLLSRVVFNVNGNVILF